VDPKTDWGLIANKSWYDFRYMKAFSMRMRPQLS